MPLFFREDKKTDYRLHKSLERTTFFGTLLGIHGNGVHPAATSFLLLLSLLTAWASARASENPSERERAPTTTLDLRGKWDFAYTTSRTEKVPPHDAFKTSMPVPGCWDDSLTRSKVEALWPGARFNPDYVALQLPLKENFANTPDASLPYLLGTGWYRKQLEVPDNWRGRRITLRVGRVVMEAWLHINGRQVHHHLGHSTPWEVSLGDHLRYGQSNEILLVVDNTRTDRLGCVIRGWKGRSAGIFGPVSLNVAGSTRIADLFVYPEGNQLRWRVEIQGQLPQEGKLRWKVWNGESDKMLAKGFQNLQQHHVQWSTGKLGIPPWSDEEPNLVQIELALIRDGECFDIRRQPFGLRRLAREGVGLRLNDHPVYLRGVCDSAYYPSTCTPPVDVDWYRGHIRALKRLGFNWVRCHTWVPTEPYLQAADELGMLVQVEPPRGYAMNEWRDIMRFCRTHPSVVIYCCGNEERLNEEKIAFLRSCAEELRKVVPDALFNPQEAMPGVEYGFLVDERPKLATEPFEHHPERLGELKKFSDVFGQYALGRLSYFPLWSSQSELDRCLAVYERPCLTHELGIIGCYLDLELEGRYQGTRIGPDLFVQVRRSLRESGLLDRSKRYHRNSVAWQELTRKDLCEMARKCRLIAGYDMLGANDLHWHRSGYGCGVMNEFDELKTGLTTAGVLQYNGPSILMISEQRKRNLRMGETLSRELLVSWFGREPLKEATAEWVLQASDGCVLGQGRHAVATVAPGKVAKIADIRLNLPNLKAPAKASLLVKVSGPACQLDNRWDYWLFPTPETLATSHIVQTEVLDAASLAALGRGGSVVLWGHKPFPAKSMEFQPGVSGRAEGNLATVIAEHPLTDVFPHDGYCDWQFLSMLHKATPVLFDPLEVPFDPIIEVVSSYKRVRKQAALFEWRVGPGRLMVCSLNLPGSDPAAAYFRHCLLRYVNSGRFQPRVKVDLAEFARMVKLDTAPLEKKHDTDKAYDAQGQLPVKKEQSKHQSK